MTDEIDYPVYSEVGYVDVPNGNYICRKFSCYGEPREEMVNIYNHYLPSHYECVLRPYEGDTK